MALEQDPSGTSVVGLCEMAGFSPQAFYKKNKARQRQVVEEDGIIEQVKSQRRIHPQMGVRKILKLIKTDLDEMGIYIGRDRFFDLLRERDMLIIRKARRKQTTDSNHGFRVYSNLIYDYELTGPNQVWVSDITYIRTSESFMYLSLITDAYSRKIVGYHINNTLEAIGCMKSLQMALSGLPEGAYPIHHSDRGSQYCCKDYVKMLENRGLSISMTEVSHCYENSKAERVNGILKQEYLLGSTFRSQKQAIAATHQAVQIYNDLRPHLSLKYETPSYVHSQVA